MNIERDQTFVQCTKCGYIHIVERKIPMEKAIIKSYCERCGNGRALNCGYNENDVAILADSFLDERYFIY